jgi:hypothetical protein
MAFFREIHHCGSFAMTVASDSDFINLVKYQNALVKVANQ